VKRKIASRKLKRTCNECNRSFIKGDVYYIRRKVFDDYGGLGIIAFEFLECPKCRYKKVKHAERFEKFKPNCHHPIFHEVWSYIPGEYVMQPDHDECDVCGEWL
jgi:hypothetical protein